jgi:hypothetical protein
MADIPLVQLPYPEEETRTFELSTSLSPNWDKNGRIFYTDETGQVVRPQTKYNPLQMLGRRLKAFGSNAKNFVEDFNMDKSHTYFAPFEDINEQYKAGNIDKSELPYLAQGRAEQEIREAQQQERDNINRGWLGTGLSAASMLPIFNIPYVGTGLGGAMYDLGQGITEGNNADELWDRTKRGFAIGESVGAIPYVGKFAGKTKAGQAVGSALNKAGEKFANTKLYDALMTDIKAFNPNKQTAYHGSPYDFNKFSNEAIGTGEGVQAHGYGHYAALDKNVADNRYRKRLTTSSKEEVSIDNKYKPLYEEAEKKYDNLLNNLYKQKQNGEITEEFYQNAIDNSKEAIEVDNILSAWQNEVASLKGKKLTPNEGQLFKLSVPKDDVMLREDLPFSEQPKKVQEALKKLANTYNDTFDSDIILQSINKNKTGKQIYKNLEFDLSPDWQAAGEELYNNGIKGISYNGGIDGEARVIFNPEDIEIVRKYYNQPGLFEQLTGKQNTGALIDSLYNK